MRTVAMMEILFINYEGCIPISYIIINISFFAIRFSLNNTKITMHS